MREEITGNEADLILCLACTVPSIHDAHYSRLPHDKQLVQLLQQTKNREDFRDRLSNIWPMG